MYEWIQTTFNVGGGVTQAIAVILALAVVLMLFGLFIFILKRLTGTQSNQNRNRQPRIAVMDSAAVDSRRRLLLIRRDNIEHLILVGGPSDVVVEQNIMRNAPLTQPRPGQHAAPGTAAVRTPMAPGPEIPPRPDDLAVHNQEPPSPPAMNARTLVAAMAASEADAPKPAPQKPAAATSAPLTSGAMRDPAPLGKATGSTEAPAAKADAGGGLNRAADLLRAATQNGFNRGPSRDRPAPAEPLPSTAPAAPAVRPVAKPAEQASAPGESRTSAALKTLTRPFSPRERPSYGSQTITPPASGPAARAKTALLKPVEPEQPRNKIEPALAAAAPVGATVATPVATPVTTSVSTSSQAPAVVPPTVPAVAAPDVHENVAATGAVSLRQDATSTANAQPETVKTATPSPETGDGSAPEIAEESIRGQTAPVSARSEAATTADTDKVAISETPSEQEGATETDDLFEEAPSAPPSSPNAPAAQAQAQTQAQADDQTPPETVSEGSEAVETSSNGEAEEKVKADAGASAPRTGGGLGDKNPIEDEMAKILHELGGQSN